MTGLKAHLVIDLAPYEFFLIRPLIMKLALPFTKANKSDAGNGSIGVCFHFDIFLLAVA
jgi:hypothetical protein